ncbi:hypothetical protein AAC387_Pa03g0812 [Persea americana]
MAFPWLARFQSLTSTWNNSQRNLTQHILSAPSINALSPDLVSSHPSTKMPRISSLSAKKWPERAANTLSGAVSFLVFFWLDMLDFVLCIVYRLLDYLMEGNSPPCYCENRGEQGMNGGTERQDGVSETLHGRKNFFRDLGLLRMRRIRRNCGKMGGPVTPRWSDCGCDSCNAWQKNRGKLHLVVMEPPQETVFPNLSEAARLNYRLVAVDLLGFGRSPKPGDSLYRLEDHLESVEKSINEPFQLISFHLVAHSMGCIIALAFAAKYPNSVKSLTLIAPPFFPSTKEKASYTALNRLAQRKLWPPLLFGSSVMSWYEHVGRSVCFLICRNHRKWEWILRLIRRKRDLHFTTIDITRHTHHSAWHTMHNVICGGAKLLDDYLEVVNKSRAQVTVIHGDTDKVVPLECSYNVKLKVPLAEVRIISSANHNTIVFGREKDLARDLELIWYSSGIQHEYM